MEGKKWRMPTEKRSQRKRNVKALTLFFCMQKFFVYKCRLNKPKPTLEAFINDLKYNILS